MILSIDLQDLQLNFRVLDTPLAELWVERMSLRHAWLMDDQRRFYGFDSVQVEETRALDKINHCIQQILTHDSNVRHEPVTSVHDQDTLNYWHHVFETGHGFLEQQDQSNPLTAVLAELNIAVHRCESVARGNRPRFVCTWYGMPKTQTVNLDVMQNCGTLSPKFGTVCLNYCEIGKTLEDLTQDRDNYISDQAFRPFSHYSADFNVRMHEETLGYISDKVLRMKHYYQAHSDFFLRHGYNTFDDPRLLPLRFPVAELIETRPRHELLEAIQQRQKVTQVTLQ